MYLSRPKIFFIPVNYIDKEILDIEEIKILPNNTSNYGFKKQLDIVKDEFIKVIKSNIYNDCCVCK
ncbi:hypothetical protein [Clostridium gasigenes]|uniref:Uncharacterized protein n=1 Tax=Clostridium gasigenes TaxID=94869 RepID=A0A1H0VJT5_9CLOT|nr:hypothetical protein [Clostridium gasigenes]MBB6625337.1 hypothetical protein [Clostridium gasigenes]MBB6715550.1 hypothetical protein [Clostridium gasigenes]MBU3089973.1 hypothetical protein [Clostridium gasigenes]MBU3106991.1 hypothetical protein [Clostridium gasigenes]SDP78832.1 hypothetical protein SAMN04488529_11739 [Clostridium gasigenes]